METLHALIGEPNLQITWWQMCIRAAIILVYAVILYRLAPRRSMSGLTALDIVLTVVLGSSLGRALTGNAPLLPTLAAAALLVVMHGLLSVLARHSELVSRVVKGRSIRLIRDGAVDWDAMRRSRLGPRDLHEQLRLKGIADPKQVSEAYLERNGNVSIVRAPDT